MGERLYLLDCEPGRTGVGAVTAAATPPVLGPAPIQLVKYQQR